MLWGTSGMGQLSAGKAFTLSGWPVSQKRMFLDHGSTPHPQNWGWTQKNDAEMWGANAPCWKAVLPQGSTLQTDRTSIGQNPHTAGVTRQYSDQLGSGRHNFRLFCSLRPIDSSQIFMTFLELFKKWWSEHLIHMATCINLVQNIIYPATVVTGWIKRDETTLKATSMAHNLKGTRFVAPKIRLGFGNSMSLPLEIQHGAHGASQEIPKLTGWVYCQHKLKI